jgi:DNA-binding HxlR family transcriptional regulator
MIPARLCSRGLPTPGTANYREDVTAATKQDANLPACSVERSLVVLGERWTFLVIREAFLGRTRFSEFQHFLGVSAGRLSARLKVLVDAGVLERHGYHETGQRERFSYHLTPAGRDLVVVMGALQQWGDRYRPRPVGPSSARRRKKDGGELSVAFVDHKGRAVPNGDVEFVLLQKR